MKELALALLPLVLLIGSSSGQLAKSCPIDNFSNTEVTYDDVRKTSSFGLDLFRSLRTKVPGRNIFISPYSVWSALTIAYFGAEGNTLAQLQKTLRLGEKDRGFKIQRQLSVELSRKKGVQLDVANRAYLADFLDLEECVRRAEFYDVHQRDFSDPIKLAQDVNGFVNKTTKGLISQIVTPSALARATFILVNAIYFKGTWEHEFSRRLTNREDFYCSPGVPCGNVAMMTRQESRLNYVNNTNLGAEVVELPYSNSTMSMLLFLPWLNVNTVDGVVDRLNLPSLSATVNALSTEKILLKVPKFRMEESLSEEMLAALADLGVTDLFTKNADLSAFTKSFQLNADTIIHKAVVDVNEEGTEAAAVTAILPVRTFIAPPLKVTLNRPFVFMIVDKQLGLTLFSGIYRNPPV